MVRKDSLATSQAWKVALSCSHETGRSYLGSRVVEAVFT